MFEIYNEDCLVQLDKLEENSIDSIVTDPPYELNFMSKGWDNAGVSFNKDTWQKCLRVLKPGGYLLAFGGSRTYHRIAVAIEDAGFEIRDTIMWLYGSGFPKSMDISKQIDKIFGNNKFKQKEIEFVKWFKNKSTKNAKELDKIFGWKTRAFHFFSENDSNRHIPNWELYTKIKKECNLTDEMDNFIKKHSLLLEEIRDVQGYENSIKNWDKKYIKPILDKPATNLAKQWQGWGTALKPSFEPIIVARKPFKGSLVDNVIEYGVGGINIDECRVETSDKWVVPAHKSKEVQSGYQRKNKSMFVDKPENVPHENGRFPANTILTYDDTDFEEVCGGFPDTKSQKTNSKLLDIRGNNYNNANKVLDVAYERGYTDSGSASRYFYCAKASKKDRDEGLDTFEQEKVNDGRNTPIDNAFQRGETLRKNTHPTVKPTELMQYLIRLVTPDGGTVLDPFMGSGSTGKAVMYENKERNKKYKFIGIEKDKEYCEIAKARISYAEKQITKEQEEKDNIDQISLF